MPYSREGRWSKGAIAAWVAWILGTIGLFAFLEWRGLRREGDEAPPLTYLIRRYVPAWLLFAAGGAGVGWLIWHFVATYLT